MSPRAVRGSALRRFVGQVCNVTNLSYGFLQSDTARYASSVDQ